MFSTVPAAIEYIKGGKLRPLAVTTATRSEALPDVPTVGDFLPGFESSQWYGVGAPTGTPADIVATINREINAGLADPKLKARIADLGGVPMPMTPGDFGKAFFVKGASRHFCRALLRAQSFRLLNSSRTTNRAGS